MPPAALLLLLLHHLLLTSAAPISGLDSFLSLQARKDPPASNDSFLSLPSSIKTSLSHPLPTHCRWLYDTYLSSDPDLSPPRPRSLPKSPNPKTQTTRSTPPTAKSLPDPLSLTISPPTSTPIRSSLTPCAPLPRRSMIIRDDFDKEKHANSFHIYIIHLGSQQTKPYAYSYTPGESSPGSTKCLGTIWTGKDRYLWIDLGAGPVDYGPALSGDGVIPKGEFHPMAALHGRPKSQKALLSDLASLVSSAYQVLLVPSLRIPVPFESKLVVQFIHISGGEGFGSGSVGLDWNSIERNFRDDVNDRGLLVGDQSLSFKRYELKYSECSICSFAIARATTSYTSRYLFDNYTLIVSEYLDSKRLHQTILESNNEFRRVGRIPEEEFGRILPVYVFDLDINAILLLDRYHQSVAFKDMVIAIRTKSTQAVSDYSCNGHHVFIQTRELERPLVGSILQSMWGVSPTHTVWSPRHNSSLMDYTWSVGQTPFGPFSEMPTLSFVQKDAARRNVFLTSLNYSVTSGIDVLESIAAHGGERKLLGHNRRTEFYQRWNLFRYKLEKSISALSHFDYEMALYYLRSSDHDLYGMHSLVYQASQELEASLVCFKDPPFPWASFLMSVGICIALVYACAKRDKFFQNKRKQF
ncbi:uncharacterized protein LOC125198562 [Salvia hispanica]|uniref:uncharacterized protein LOC125198562 n=1 Tax=Salvia hispanica TaxID=49212 RepID=UPI00200931E2|nr:uncharacterized protein LOC125198562 [Salvia hispanica]